MDGVIELGQTVQLWRLRDECVLLVEGVLREFFWDCGVTIEGDGRRSFYPWHAFERLDVVTAEDCLTEGEG